MSFFANLMRLGRCQADAGGMSSDVHCAKASRFAVKSVLAYSANVQLAGTHAGSAVVLVPAALDGLRRAERRDPTVGWLAGAAHGSIAAGVACGLNGGAVADSVRPSAAGVGCS
jgi:hypothetical protein